MDSYKELEVWQKAINLVVEIYKTTKDFPQTERYALADQVQRSAISIPANIAEGWGRRSTKEYIHFLTVARGSLMELETHMVIAEKLGYLREEYVRGNRNEMESIGMMLNRLIQSLSKRR